MKTYKLFGIVLITLILTLGCSSNDDNPAPSITQPTDPSEFSQASAIGMEVKWRVTQDSKLEIQASAPTTGWIGIGFNPTGKMDGANLLVGFQSDTEIMVRDGYGSGHQWQLDSIEHVESISGTQTSDALTLTFIIPLNSKDNQDQTLEQGTSTMLLMSYGGTILSSSSFSRHTKRISMQISI